MQMMQPPPQHLPPTAVSPQQQQQQQYGAFNPQQRNGAGYGFPTAQQTPADTCDEYGSSFSQGPPPVFPPGMTVAMPTVAKTTQVRPSAAIQLQQHRKGASQDATSTYPDSSTGSAATDESGYEEGAYEEGGYDEEGAYDEGGYDEGAYDEEGYEEGDYNEGNYDESSGSETVTSPSRPVPVPPARPASFDRPQRNSVGSPTSASSFRTTLTASGSVTLSHPASSASSAAIHGPVLSLKLIKKQSSLIYNSRERRLLQDILTFFITEQPHVIDYVFQHLAKDDVEPFISSTVNLTFSRSTTLELLRHFVEEEFKKHAGGEAEAGNTLFRENSIASKILKVYLKLIGRGFLNELLGAIEREVCIRESKVTYEIDPVQEPDDMERARNLELLTAKIDKFLSVITSHVMVDKMPPGIRIIAAYFDNFAKKYCPNMNADALVGGFLMLRYINPAIMTPDLSGLIPPGKQITPKARRNLLLITKVLQNMSNGLLFTKKEPYLMVLNPWLELNTPRLQRSFHEIVKAASSCSTNLIIDSDVCSATVNDLQVLHQVFFHFYDGIAECIVEPESKQLFKAKMESLGTYARKITFANQLDATEQAHVRGILTKYHEEPSYVCIMDIKKGKALAKCIFVVGNNRLFLLRKKPKVVPGSSLVKHEAHILTLMEIRLKGTRGISLIFRTFEIDGETDDREEVVACVKRAFLSNFSHFPREIMFKVTATPPAAVPPDEDFEIFREEHNECGGFVKTYKALCDFYNAPVSDTLCWDLKNLYADNFVFDLKHLFSDEAADTEFVPALHALRYNTHFTSFINDTFKIKATQTLQGLSSLFKCNTTLTSLSLPSPGFGEKVMLNLFEAILSNPSCHIVHFNLTDCELDEKAANALGSIVAKRPVGNGVKTLVLDSSLHTLKVFHAFCKSACDTSTPIPQTEPLSAAHSTPGVTFGAQELEVLSLAHCKIGDEVTELTKCLSSGCGTSLRTLNVAASGITGALLNSFLIALPKACKNLEKLDVSDLKFTSAEVITVSQMFLIPSCRVSVINMSGSLPSTSALLQFLVLGKPGMSLTTILRNHTFSNDPASLKLLCETMPKALSVTTLDLSDTDIGDDGVFYLVEGLTLNKTLENLNISGSFRNDSKRPRQETVRALAKLLMSDCPIKTLEMAGGPKATQQLGRTIIILFQALMHNSSLTSLDVSGHMFGTAGAKALAKVIQLNATLTRLVYDQNDIGLIGLSAIAEGVAANSTLEVFPLPVLDITSILSSDHSSDTQRKVQNVCESLQLALSSSK